MGSTYKMNKRLKNMIRITKSQSRPSKQGYIGAGEVKVTDKVLLLGTSGLSLASCFHGKSGFEEAK